MAKLSKVQRHKRTAAILGEVYAILIYAVLYIPIVVMMVFSFNDQRYNYYWNGFTTPPRSSGASGTPLSSPCWPRSSRWSSVRSGRLA